MSPWTLASSDSSVANDFFNTKINVQRLYKGSLFTIYTEIPAHFDNDFNIFTFIQQ